MFKPVYDNPTAVARFVEQSTLVHEFGHAAGLVNNGVSLTSAHHDSEYGAHCTNTACVMYYLNEGAADMLDFVQRYSVSGETVIFGEECLEDAHSAARGNP